VNLTHPFLSVAGADSGRFLQWIVDRPIAAALVLSALLHAILLWILPGILGNGGAAPKVLQVSLFRVPESRPAATRPPPAPKIARHAAPRTLAPEQALPAEPRTESGPAPEAVPQPPVVLTAPSTGGEEPAMVEAPPRPRVREEFDENALANYGQTLSKLLARNQSYPRLAQIRRWEGKVQLRVFVAKKGTITHVVITQSSGYEVLDQRAVEMVKEANPLPDMPESLRGREFSIVVPVLFRLEGS
jgi:periplasmic protein TonB